MWKSDCDILRSRMPWRSDTGRRSISTSPIRRGRPAPTWPRSWTCYHSPRPAQSGRPNPFHNRSGCRRETWFRQLCLSRYNRRIIKTTVGRDRKSVAICLFFAFTIRVVFKLTVSPMHSDLNLSDCEDEGLFCLPQLNFCYDIGLLGLHGL